MNIEQANAISIVEILSRLSCSPAKIRGNDYWYHSPLRDEKTASFKVNVLKNFWYDFGEGKGGDATAFVCTYLRSTHEADSVHDALRWLANMTGQIAIHKQDVNRKQCEEPSRFILKDVRTIEHRSLVAYLQSRGISQALAKTYLKELRILNSATGKSFFALGFQNEDDHYEVRSPYMKSCLGSKAISFIRGTEQKQTAFHVFEGSMDFLSALAARQRLKFNEDAIILNSISCLQSAFPYIKNYGYRIAYSWFDNDNAGRKAERLLADFLDGEEALRHRPMNRIYSPHKDVNAWHMFKLGLKG